MDEGMPYFAHPGATQTDQVISALFIMKSPPEGLASRSREAFGHCPSDTEGDYIYPDPTTGEGDWPGYWVVPYHGKHDVFGGEQASSSSGEMQMPMHSPFVETADPSNEASGTVFAQYAPYQHQPPQVAPTPTQAPVQTPVYRTSPPAPLPGRRFHSPPPAEPVARTMARPTAPSATANMASAAPRPQLSTTITNTLGFRSESPANPLGPKVGESVPNDIAIIVNEIKLRSRDGAYGLPKRKDLMVTDLLIRTHFWGGTGVFRPESPLREWYGDERLFSMGWWEYLASPKPRGG